MMKIIMIKMNMETMELNMKMIMNMTTMNKMMNDLYPVKYSLKLMIFKYVKLAIVQLHHISLQQQYNAHSTIVQQ